MTVHKIKRAIHHVCKNSQVNYGLASDKIYASNLNKRVANKAARDWDTFYVSMLSK